MRDHRFLCIPALLFLLNACADYPDAPSIPEEKRVAVTNNYGLEPLGYLPGGGPTWATDINDPGVIVGWGQAHEPVVEYRAFKYENGQLIELPLSRAYGINDAGWIVGALDGAAAVLSPDGQVTVLTRSDGPVEGLAFDINQSGVIVGRTRSAGGHWQATRWTPHNGVYFGQSLETFPVVESQATALNDAGEIVGSVTHAVNRTGRTSREAWQWHDGPLGEGLGTLSEGDDAVATAINNGGFLDPLGLVVGYGNMEPGGSSHGFVRLPGDAGLAELDLPGQWSVVNDLSDRGRLTGWYTTAGAAGSLTYDGDYWGIVPLTTKPYTKVAGKIIVLYHTTIFSTDGGSAAAVNACGTIVGHVITEFMVSAVRWVKPVCDP